MKSDVLILLQPAPESEQKADEQAINVFQAEHTEIPITNDVTQETPIEQLGRGMRRKPKRVRVVDDCICGNAVTEEEIEEKRSVQHCSAQGCETVWVRM